MARSGDRFSRSFAIFATACALATASVATGCGSADDGRPGDDPSTGVYSADAAAASADDDGATSADASAVDATHGPTGDSGHDGATTHDAGHDAGNTNGCPVVAYPSGVHIQTKPNSARTAEYTSIADNGAFPLPKCFVDVDDLYDPVANTTYDVNVMVGKHYALSELVGTELPYGHAMLLSEVLVAKLDAYRDALGVSVNLTSGFRSPAHQRAVCRGLCGADSCPGTCAARSRHSWGDAADHGVPPSKHYADAACSAKFNFVFREGDHMHLDLDPEHPICTVSIL